jgi:hypothetical protein
MSSLVSIKSFILANWELRETPTQHPRSENFLIGYGLETLNQTMTLTKEEAANLLEAQIEHFLEKELPKEFLVYVEKSNTLEVLYSLRLYFGRELFYKSQVFSYLINCVRFGKGSEIFFSFLKVELTKVTYKLEKKIYHSSWAKLRESERDYLKSFEALGESNG